MIVVLEKPSKKKTISINKNPSIPKPYQLMTAIGMGTQSPNNKHTHYDEFLQEITVRRTPHGVCRQSNKRVPLDINRKANFCAYPSTEADKQPVLKSNICYGKWCLNYNVLICCNDNRDC